MDIKKNKSKKELISEIEYKQQVERDKTLVKMIWPHLDNQASVYDAQTVVNALSGYIKASMAQKEEALKLSDLGIDLSDNPDSDIKKSMLELIGMLAPENAKTTSILLERLGNALAQFGAAEFLKGKMEKVTLSDILAE